MSRKRELVVYVDEDGTTGALKKKGKVAWHPFETDYGDHFETSDDAVTDIAHIITALAKSLGKQPADLRIYDPYYCAGSIKATWRNAGFPLCYNENEDCYAVWEAQTEPEHDVVITNPPYSGKHKEWCIEHCVRSGKPWLLLLPGYCATKQYFSSIVGDAQCAFIIPEKVYRFTHPEGTGSDESPFHSIWMGSFGPHHRAVVAASRRNYSAAVRVEESVAQLKKDNVVPGKRPNPKQRRKMQQRLG